MSVRCEDVRELLPQIAEWGPRPAGDVEVHLATCAACGAELASYREMLTSLTEFRSHEVDPPEGFLDRTIALIPEAEAGHATWRSLPGQVAAAARRRPAVASLTGAAVGAAALGVILWRRGRRAIGDAARVPELAPS